MKKRFLLPLLAIAAPITIGVADAAVHIAGCSLGNQGACEELDRRKAHSEELAAAKSDHDSCLELRAQINELQAGLGDKSYDCDRVKNWVAPKDRLAAAGGRTQLIRNCEATFKPLLKDPASYRYQGADVVANASNGMDVTVRYTATNSFGGRVQETHTCAS